MAETCQETGEETGDKRHETRDLPHVSRLFSHVSCLTSPILSSLGTSRIHSILISPPSPTPTGSSRSRVIGPCQPGRPASSTFSLRLRELHQYRHLVRALIWRNVRVQFDAMHLGFLWACTRPLLYVFVFAVFRNLSGADTRVEIPYMLYVYSGLVLWYYFMDATRGASNALRAASRRILRIRACAYGLRMTTM
jgi:hypothetical protein